MGVAADERSRDGGVFVAGTVAGFGCSEASGDFERCADSRCLRRTDTGSSSHRIGIRPAECRQAVAKQFARELNGVLPSRS